MTPQSRAAPDPEADPAPVERSGLAVLAILVTIVMWGSSSVAIKAVGSSGLVTALYRLWFAIPLLWISALLPQVRSTLDRRWLRGSVVGGSLFAVHQVLYFSGLKLTTVTNMNIIGALQPVLVLWVAGPLFGEHTSRSSALWSAAALAGTALVVAGARAAPTWSAVGDAVAVLNLFAFTAYFLASKRVRATTGAWAYVVGMTTISGLVMLFICLATGQDLGSPRGFEWLVILAIAIFPGTLGHVLMNWAHAHVSAFSISMLLLGVPVVAAAGAALVLGEHITGLQILGGAVVLIAIANVVLRMDRRTAEVLAESAAETDAP
jgi:drug/metabolite transporter (DMT)-like permease